MGSGAGPAGQRGITAAKLGLPLLGRGGVRGCGCRAGLLLRDPERMVLLGPVEVDLPAAHRIERPLHAERADIDVRQHGGDEQHGEHAVGRCSWLKKPPPLFIHSTSSRPGTLSLTHSTKMSTRPSTNGKLR